MKFLGKMKLLICFFVGMATFTHDYGRMTLGDWIAIATLAFGGTGLYLTIRKEIRENAREREEKEGELIDKIDKKFVEHERRMKEVLTDLKVNQTSGIGKIETLNQNFLELKADFNVHKNSPGHPGAIDGILELKKMVSELAAAIARKT